MIIVSVSNKTPLFFSPGINFRMFLLYPSNSWNNLNLKIEQLWISNAVHKMGLVQKGGEDWFVDCARSSAECQNSL